MNYFKKLLAVVISLCIFTSVVPIQIGTYATFLDVNDADHYTDYVDSLAEKGIIKGYSQDNFGPDDICTRAQFLTFLWRASQEPKVEDKATFTDVKGGEYYADAVSWAYKNFITKIYSDGSFGWDKPVDREHAAYFLYNWAKIMENSDTRNTALLDEYKDRGEISLDSRLAFAWAVRAELLAADENGNLNPKTNITRADAACIIGKLLDTHYCNMPDWKDEGNGSHSRTCAKDASHVETEKHTWNDGELSVAPTDKVAGVITYTCTKCYASKKESAPAGTEYVTRKDLEEAIVNTAIAYYVKNPYMQYDSTHTTDMSAYTGGLIRLTAKSAPELATKDSNFYSVCSDYVYQSYLEAINIQAMGDVNFPFGLSTAYLFKMGDNQPQTQVVSGSINDPICEDDVDACLMRWMDYDEYMKSYSSRAAYSGFGVFESESFTDFTEGLIFRDDGYEGEMHYSYYNSEGKRLTPAEVRETYVYSYAQEYEKTLRPGDFFVNHSHSMLYVGGNDYLHCAGYKINTETGVDKTEEGDAIRFDHNANEKIYASNIKSMIVLRPLEFVVKMGYDEDPGNDIVKNLTIPEETKSRIKYPAMSIDRTVDISSYGTAVKGDSLTYTVEITNKTNDESYKEWHTTSGKTGQAEKPYENLLVTETIPDGCELVENSVSGEGKVENGKISWNLKTVNPGETVALSYKVKVTADVGATITNDGGMVDNIPSNSLQNTVGNKKLDADANKILSEISQGGNEGLKVFGADTDFAENIYKKIGKDLDLPSATEIIKSIFHIKKGHIPGDGGPLRAYTSEPIDLFELRTEVPAEYEEIRAMLIDKYWGGRRFFAGEDNKWDFANNAINEFRKEYMEPGDIIVYAKSKDRSKNNLSDEFDVITVVIYDGSGLVSVTSTPDGVVYEVVSKDAMDAELTKALQTDKDLFFALRPSQAK